MVDYSFSLVGFEYFLLILVRVASFLFAAPIFNQAAVTPRVKVGFAVLTAAVLYGVVEQPKLEYESVIGFALIVIKEIFTGLIIGYGANICSTVLLFAGNIIDMDIGLSMVQEFNPEMNTQISITGNLYTYFVGLLLISSGMHVYALRAACESFVLIPIGGAEFKWNDLMTTMVRYMTDMFAIGFRIFLPFFAVMMVLNCILGIMAKIAPQMNMFAVGMQLKVLTGLITLFLTIYLLPHISDFLFDEIKKMVVLLIDGMG